MRKDQAAFRPERSWTPSDDSTPTTFHRTRTTASDPTADLTPEQQLLDTQLRAWRKAESERIGLPQFFVLGSSTLRSIVLQRPRTLAQLQTISGIGPDKAQKFGASIVSSIRVTLAPSLHQPVPQIQIQTHLQPQS